MPGTHPASSKPLPSRSDFNSDGEFYAYLRKEMAEFGLSPEEMHMDMVGPEFVEKLRIDFVGTAIEEVPGLLQRVDHDVGSCVQSNQQRSEASVVVGWQAATTDVRRLRIRATLGVGVFSCLVTIIPTINRSEVASGND